jgi:hypothetical protein
MTRPTSKEAHDWLQASGKLSKYQRQIMLFMHSRPKGTALTRRAISDYARIPINACPRAVGVLIERGYLEETEAEKDLVTGFMASRLRIKQTGDNMATIQTIGFQCVIEEEKDGKKREKLAGRMYVAKTACEDLVEMYKRSGVKAWMKEVCKVEGGLK